MSNTKGWMMANEPNHSPLIGNIGAGLALGVAAGAVLGAVTDNLGLGLIFGALLGLGIGSAVKYSADKERRRLDERDRRRTKK